MKINEKSKEILRVLYNTLINGDSPYLSVTISLKQLAEKNNMTDKKVNQCLCYLKSAGYVNCNIDYQASGDEVKSIALTASAIDMLEEII